MFAMRPPVQPQTLSIRRFPVLKGAAGERAGADYLNLTAVDGLKAKRIKLVVAARPHQALSYRMNCN
jgi:hypothetical protein